MIVLLWSITGCNSSDGNAKLPAPQTAPRLDDSAVRQTKDLLASYGSTEGLEPDAVITRDVTITTDEGSFTLEGSAVVHGAAGIAQNDPATGELLWRAGTCVHPSCVKKGEGGRPFLFVYAYDATQIDPANGKLLTHVFEDPVCPKCGQSKFIQEYILPGVAERRAQLDAELKASRKARDAAKFKQTPIPAGTRTPNEIVRERALLPRLYLPEDKYAN